MGVTYICYCREHDEYCSVDKAWWRATDMTNRKSWDELLKEPKEELRYLAYHGLVLMEFVRKHDGCKLEFISSTTDGYSEIILSESVDFSKWDESSQIKRGGAN